jgi:hypothetical protein
LPDYDQQIPPSLSCPKRRASDKALHARTRLTTRQPRRNAPTNIHANSHAQPHRHRYAPTPPRAHPSRTNADATNADATNTRLWATRSTPNPAGSRTHPPPQQQQNIYYTLHCHLPTHLPSHPPTRAHPFHNNADATDADATNARLRGTRPTPKHPPIKRRDLNTNARAARAQADVRQGRQTPAAKHTQVRTRRGRRRPPCRAAPSGSASRTSKPSKQQ